MARKKTTAPDGGLLWSHEDVSISSLRPHPRNYRSHPEDQLEHIRESIREHGLYRNVVIARDGTILAGHGVVLACRSLGIEMIPVRRLDVSPDEPRAIKVLTGDNEIAKLGEVDDRALTELLKEVKESDQIGLLGTGFDEQLLTNLVFVTRTEDEIRDHDDAAAWVGLPGYENPEKPLKAVISFRCEEDRREFARLLGLTLGTAETVSSWYPPREREDLASVRFQVEEGDGGPGSDGKGGDDV